MYRTKKWYKEKYELLIEEQKTDTKKIEDLKKDVDNYKDSAEKLDITLKIREKDLKKSTADNIKYQATIIKLKDELAVLKKLNKEYEKKLKNSFTVTKVRPAVPRKGQTMGIKSSTKQSKIIKAVKGVDNEE